MDQSSLFFKTALKRNDPVFGTISSRNYNVLVDEYGISIFYKDLYKR